MSTAVELHRVSYSIPGLGDTGWGDTLAAYLTALAESVSGMVTFGATSGAGGATVYMAPGNGAAGATEVKMVMPMACVVGPFTLRCTAAPTTNSIVATVRINGADTSLTATLTTSDTSAASSTDVQVAQGDTVSIKLTQTSGGGGTNLVATLAFHAKTGD